jgi:hypothetical protein
MLAVSCSALNVAIPLFNIRGVAWRLCVPTVRPVHHGLASEAALQGYRTWYSTPLMTPSSNPPRSR